MTVQTGTAPATGIGRTVGAAPCPRPSGGELQRAFTVPGGFGTGLGHLVSGVVAATAPTVKLAIEGCGGAGARDGAQSRQIEGAGHG